MNSDAPQNQKKSPQQQLNFDAADSQAKANSYKNKLREMNIDESQLDDLKQIFEAQNSDIYDVLAHISFNLDIKTRSERVIAVESSTFVEKYHNEKAKE